MRRPAKRSSSRMTVRFNARSKFQRWIILDTPFRTPEYNLLALRFAPPPLSLSLSLERIERYDRIIPDLSALTVNFNLLALNSRDQTIVYE